MNNTERSPASTDNTVTGLIGSVSTEGGVVSLGGVPILNGIGEGEKIPSLDYNGLKTVVTKLSADPQQAAAMSANAMASVDPESAKKIKAMTQQMRPQQQQLQAILKEKGITQHDAQTMKRQMRQNMKAARSNPLTRNNETPGLKETYILLTTTKRVKAISLTLDELLHKFHGIQGLEEHTLDSDSSITMYFDSQAKGNNKKASTLRGATTGGDVYLHRSSPPLTISDIDKLFAKNSS